MRLNSAFLHFCNTFLAFPVPWLPGKQGQPWVQCLTGVDTEGEQCPVRPWGFPPLQLSPDFSLSEAEPRGISPLSLLAAIFKQNVSVAAQVLLQKCPIAVSNDGNFLQGRSSLSTSAIRGCNRLQNCVCAGVGERTESSGAHDVCSLPCLDPAPRAGLSPGCCRGTRSSP